MNKSLATAGGHHAAVMYDNLIMTGSPVSPPVRLLQAPFAKRTWTELCYALVSFPLAIAGFIFTVAGIGNGPLLAASALGVRKFGAASRFLAGTLLDEHVPDPPRIQPLTSVRVATPSPGPAYLAKAAVEAGAKARVWDGRSGVTVRGLSVSQVAELAAEAGITVAMLPSSTKVAWFAGALRDKPAWRTRGYLAAKLPLAAADLLVVAACWLGGLFLLTYPVWRTLVTFGLFGPFHPLAQSFLLVPVGVALLFAGPWLVHNITTADRYLIRSLLGPHSAAERVRALEESRARVVDDSTARLRGIERDLHDGTQAQLVALAMKLGLAREKLGATAPVDLVRITQLVDDAHHAAVEAIAELRTVTRGIHPPVLDNGLADALATLAARSAVPVELVTDIPERPSAAIEAIAYFSAAELLTNIAKHSGARHATLETVHVPGLLRIRVTDDGHGGASPSPQGGLYGLAERVRTVDGRLEIASPRGGPTVVTVELPSHA